jgi:hypothetical protein
MPLMNENSIHVPTLYVSLYVIQNEVLIQCLNERPA